MTNTAALSVTVGFRLAMVRGIDSLEGDGPYTKEQLQTAVNQAIEADPLLINEQLKEAGREFFAEFIESKGETAISNFVIDTKDSAKSVIDLRESIANDDMLLDAIAGERSLDMLAHQDALRGMQLEIATFDAAAEKHLDIDPQEGLTAEINKYFERNPYDGALA